MNSTRRENIDFIRGIAIITVIIGHTSMLLTGKGILDGRIGNVIADIIYSFHMPLFFAISGYVSAIKREERIGKQVLKDIISLYIPFLFFNSIYYVERIIAYKAGVQLDHYVDISIYGIISLLYTALEEYWFLLSLMLIKIIFDILIHYTNITFSAIAFVILYVVSVLTDDITVISYLGWGIFYVSGFVACRYMTESVRVRQVYIFLGILGIVCGFVLFQYCGELNLVIKLLVGTGIFVILLLTTERMNNRIVVNSLGKNSLMIFGFHGLLQFPVYYVFFGAIRNAYVLFALIIAVQGILILCIWLLMEHSRLFGWLQYVLHPTKAMLSGGGRS